MDYFNNLKAKGTDLWKGDSKTNSVIKAIILGGLIFIIVNFIMKGYIRYTKWNRSSPWLLKATKDASKRMIVLQNPNKYGSVPTYKSENQYGGLEFSYAMWLYIEDWSYKFGSWKHILHKGNESSWPLRAPGLWLHPKENTLRVYMNTFKNIGEYVDLPNLPLGKWFHVTVAVRQRNIDLYLNANLAKRHVLQGLPKQNFGDIYINSFRGFGGYLSNVRYYNWYVTVADLDKAFQLGPAKGSCVDTNATVPPYFSTTWWANNK